MRWRSLSELLPSKVMFLLLQQVRLKHRPTYMI